jgi:hypothetical protein
VIRSTDYVAVEAARPVEAWCDEMLVHVALADGRRVAAPLWWYPFLANASPADRSAVDLEFAGVWWPALDEGVSIKGLLLGWKAPGAREPQRAA